MEIAASVDSTISIALVDPQKEFAFLGVQAGNNNGKLLKVTPLSLATRNSVLVNISHLRHITYVTAGADD